MNDREVQVTVTRNGSQLTVAPQHIELHDGQWVRWTFAELEEGELAFISFAPPSPRLGPFHSLRSFTATSVLGKGNKGDAPINHHGYRALVLAPDSKNALATGEGTIHNAATVENTAPQIFVTYHAADEHHAEPWLAVVPDPVGLNTGDTATWHFIELPPNAFACFQFEPVVAGMNESLGPFVAFSACNGDSPVTVAASGTGFAVNVPPPSDPDNPPPFIYHIQLRAWDGTRIAVKDPAIDNLGPPPPIGL